MSSRAFDLLVCVPAQGDLVTVQTAGALLALQQLATSEGWSTTITFYAGSLLPDLRNLMIRDMLIKGADAVLMVDADTAFAPELVRRLVASGRPVVGGMSPHRRYAFDQVASDLVCRDMSQVILQATRFIGELELGSDGVSLELHDGFARAKRLGAGALLIRREALERMKGAYPELRNQGLAFDGVSGDITQENWGFFNPLLSPTSGTLMSEDFSFCERWLQCGGELWAEVATPVTHVGRTLHTASFLDHLRARFPDAVEAAFADEEDG